MKGVNGVVEILLFYPASSLTLWKYWCNVQVIIYRLFFTGQDLFDENVPNENGNSAHPICLPDATTAHTVDFCDVDGNIFLKVHFQ